jgi:hypothetical protein
MVNIFNLKTIQTPMNENSKILNPVSGVGLVRKAG